MPVTLQPSPAPTDPAGWYTDTAGVRSKWGKNNVATWSNLDATTANNSDGTPVADLTQIGVALASTDNAINALAATYSRVAPVPKTIALWGYLSDLAAYDAGIRLYEARGLVTDKAEGMGGVLAAKKKELWGDGRTPGLFQRFFKNASAIADAPRTGTVTTAPALVVSPVVAPFGQRNAVQLPGSWIPVVPNDQT